MHIYHQDILIITDGDQSDTERQFTFQIKRSDKLVHKLLDLIGMTFKSFNFKGVRTNDPLPGCFTFNEKLSSQRFVSFDYFHQSLMNMCHL